MAPRPMKKPQKPQATPTVHGLYHYAIGNRCARCDAAEAWAKYSCSRCYITQYCSAECFEALPQHVESGHCDDILYRYEEWEQRTNPLPDPAQWGAEESGKQLDNYIAHKLGALYVAAHSALGLGRGDGSGDLHRTHFLVVPLTWSGKAGGRAPWEQYEATDKAKMASFAKVNTEKGRSFASRLSFDDESNGSSICHFRFDITVGDQVTEEYRRVPVKVSPSGAPLFPLDSAWKVHLVESLNEQQRSQVLPALSQLVSATGQTKKFFRARWRWMLENLSADGRIDDPLPYNYWWFRTHPHTTHKECMDFERKNPTHLKIPFKIPPVPSIYSPLPADHSPRPPPPTVYDAIPSAFQPGFHTPGLLPKTLPLPTYQQALQRFGDLDVYVTRSADGTELIFKLALLPGTPPREIREALSPKESATLAREEAEYLARLRSESGAEA